MRRYSSRIFTAWVLFGLGAATWFGCQVDTETLYVDPAVDVAVTANYVPEGEPAVDVGFYVEQLYKPLADGDECPVVHGLQGGTWTMPAVRIRGIDIQAKVRIDVVTETGEQVGMLEQSVAFVLADDGWVEVQALPVPIQHAPPNESAPIDDLFGQKATMTVHVEDAEGRAADKTVSVVLSEG